MSSVGSCELHVSACGVIENASAGAQRVLGLNAEGLHGQLLLNRFDASSRARWRDLWLKWTREADERSVARLPEMALVRTDGSWIPTCADVRRSDPCEAGYAVVTLRTLAVTPLRGALLDGEALHDSLTGLPNRRGAREVIEAAVAVGARMHDTISVACIDLDNFRSINEDYGHDVAESVLQQVAERLRKCTQGLTRVCRTAGDEFLLIRRGPCSAEELCQFMPGLISNLRAPIAIHGDSLIVTASAGVASHACQGLQFDALMQRASYAMSRAKRLGRNTWHVAPEEVVALSQHHAIKTRLYQALHHGDLMLHYQPIVDLRTGQTRSLEALMRWSDEHLGPVSPSVFIPIAEGSGLMAELGAWTLRNACDQVALWCRATLECPPIAVNVSALQLQRREFETDLRQFIEAAGIEPRCIELEVTESALIDDAAHLTDMSRRLRSLGIGIAIDDFGTGYSNLLYLKHFHPSKIKIDRSFVQALVSTDEDRAIVRAVIDMAHAIGARVVAEGVESAEVCQALQALGCDEAQGYYFARPAAAHELGPWLQRHVMFDQQPFAA